MGQLEDMGSKIDACRVAIHEICQHLAGEEVKHSFVDRKSPHMTEMIGLEAIRAQLEESYWHG